MTKVKLGDVVERIKDFVDKDKTELVYYVGGEHFDNRSLTINNKGIIKGSTIGPAFSTKFKSGDVLLMSRNPHLRKAGIVDFDGICSDVSYIIRTKDEQVLMQRFIPLLFQSDLFWNFAEKNKKGSTNFFLNWSDFEKFEFELPKHDIQEKLCRTLWSLNNTINYYKELNRKNDELIKAIFMERFEENGFPLKKLSEVTSKITDGSHNPPKGINGKSDFMMLSSQNIVNDKINFENAKYITAEDHEKENKRTNLERGDVLLTIVGTIGRAAIVSNEKNITLQRSVAVLKPLDIVTSEYLVEAIKSDDVVKQLNKRAKGVAQKGIYLNDLKELLIPVPPIELQNQFSEFVKQIHNQKDQLEEGISSLQIMFAKIINQNLRKENE